MEYKGFEPSIIQDKNEKYIDINTVARAKGLKSNRSIRLEINKPYQYNLPSQELESVVFLLH